MQKGHTINTLMFNSDFCLEIYIKSIAKTRLYSFDPLKHNFYTVKLGFTGIYINILIFAQKHRL